MAPGSPGCDTAAPAPVTWQPRRGGRGQPELTASRGPAVKRRPLRFRRLRHRRLSQAPRGTGGRDGRPARRGVEAAASRRGPNGPGLTPSLRSTGTGQWTCGRGLGCDSEPPSPGCDSGATNSAVPAPRVWDTPSALDPRTPVPTASSFQEPLPRQRWPRGDPAGRKGIRGRSRRPAASQPPGPSLRPSPKRPNAPLTAFCTSCKFDFHSHRAFAV